MRRFILGAAAFTGFVSASAANGHDFYLMPQEFRTPGAGPVTIHATVGSSFPDRTNTVEADRVDRLIAIGAGSPKLQIAGSTATALELKVTSVKPGMLVAGVATKARDVDYAEDRIPLILEEYRVSAASVAAVEALPRPRTWRVVSRRFAKTFLCVESCRDRSAASRAFGVPLEFVGRRSSNNHFQLLAGGKPLANYPIELVGSDHKRRHLTTDTRGEVRLPAAARGTMMLFAAKLEPPAGVERFTLDLTSLTFSEP